MNDRALAVPELWRRLLAPAVLGVAGAIAAAFVTKVRRRVQEPSLPHMSDEWLRNLQATQHSTDY